MLFRPHTEKKLWGIRLPFTPGLIPKERERIAKKVGATVGTHLLTEEVMIQAVTNERVQEELSKLIEDFILTLQAKDASLNEVFSALFGEHKDSIIEYAEQMIVDQCAQQLHNPKLQQWIGDLVGERIIELLKRPIGQFQGENLFTYGKQILLEQGIAYVQGEEFLQVAKGWVSDKIQELSQNGHKLEEILPRSIVEALQQCIAAHAPQVGAQIIGYVESPVIRDKCKEMLVEFVHSHVGKLAMMFVNTDKIYDSVLQALHKYLEEPMHQKEVMDGILRFVHTIMEQRICDLIEKLPPAFKDETVGQSVEWMIQKIVRREHAHKVLFLVEEFIKQKQDQDIYSYLMKVDPEMPIKIKEKIKQYLSQSDLWDAVQKAVKEWIKVEEKALLSTNIRQWTVYIKPSYVKQFQNLFLRRYERVIQQQAPQIIRVLQIPQIVEDRINSFEVAYAEEILLSVVDKELKAITWIGAVLGFVIGFVPSIIQLLGL